MNRWTVSYGMPYRQKISVVCMSILCVACMSVVCGVYVSRVWRVSQSCVACMSVVCGVYVSCVCMSNICVYVKVVCMSNLCVYVKSVCVCQICVCMSKFCVCQRVRTHLKPTWLLSHVYSTVVFPRVASVGAVFVGEMRPWLYCLEQRSNWFILTNQLCAANTHAYYRRFLQ